MRLLLPQSSVEAIIAFLDPLLPDLETGFPTSTRPNQAGLTFHQKRLKLKSTLETDPALFLQRWGSVILYPQPERGHGSEMDVQSAKQVLDLFVPLQGDYEVGVSLNRLYLQLQQLQEHQLFLLRKASVVPASSYSMDIDDDHINNSQPSTSILHSISSSSAPPPPTSTSAPSTSPNSHRRRESASEVKRPSLRDNDVFSQRTLSQFTRRNRRLNYLLRHLAPPSAISNLATNILPAGSSSGGQSRTASSAAAGAAAAQAQAQARGAGPDPFRSAATMTSLAGTMSNLSFSDSTYFSDAEMEARQPELYQQYIGRFLDADDEEEEGGDDDDDDDDDNRGRGNRDSDDDEEAENGADADDEREEDEGNKFAPEMGLVDRILWNIDHPVVRKKRSGATGSEGEERSQVRAGPSGTSQQQEQPQQRHHQQQIPGSHSIQRIEDPQEGHEIEEEFDSESDHDGAVPSSTSPMDDQQFYNDNDDDDILRRISLTPPVPPTPVPGLLSSTFSSAAMTLEQPRDRALFAQVENGNDLEVDDADERQEEDDQTRLRKEDQEQLRQEFVLLMKEKFLDGLDVEFFDYSMVDFDENLDDLEQEKRDGEDRYFDADDDFGDDDEDDEDDEDDTGGDKFRSSRRVATTGYSRDHRFRSGMDDDEEYPQNGSGEFDY